MHVSQQKGTGTGVLFNFGFDLVNLPHGGSPHIDCRLTFAAPTTHKVTLRLKWHPPILSERPSISSTLYVTSSVRLTFSTSFYTRDLFLPAHSETALSCVFQVWTKSSITLSF